jgi:hypothetical protein
MVDACEKERLLLRYLIERSGDRADEGVLHILHGFRTIHVD